MGDYVEHTVIGDIYVELSSASVDSAQVRLGQSEAGHLFDTQACDAEGVFQADVQTSEIAIAVSGPERFHHLAASLRWLANTIESHAKDSAANK